MSLANLLSLPNEFSELEMFTETTLCVITLNSEAIFILSLEASTCLER